MVRSAVWECEWCGKQEKLSWLAALFWFLQPRFCPVTGKSAGWEHPSCRLCYALASRIAERRAKAASEETMKELHGLHLGKLRGFDEVRDIEHNERSIYSGKPYPTR